MSASPHSEARRPLLVLLALCLLALCLTGLAGLAGLGAGTAQAKAPAPSTAGASDASGTADVRGTGRRAHAERALDRVRAVFTPSTAARTATSRAAAGSRAPRDATMALRRLAVLRGSLSGTERAEADRYLARPTDGPFDPGGTGYGLGTSARSTCTSVICVHWVNTSGDGVAQADRNRDGVPDYVAKVARVVSHVHGTYVRAGYRAPKGDGTLGGSNKPDIYLADIGPDGLYGYCTSDQNISQSGPYDAWAYCVLDNDYAHDEFPTNTPAENLQVTAAHEYFHAVQFGYDIAEDGWFMEATSTWMEDELYDGVDDNLQYLGESPLRQPNASMDEFGGIRQYGDWIFFRFLTEKFRTSQAGLPTLVRDMWRRADGSATGPDQYSLQAIASTLRAHGSSLARAFSQFADANRRPSSYAEGVQNRYPRAPLAGRTRLKPGHRTTGWDTVSLDHLTSRTVRFTPSTGLGNPTWRLRLQIDMAPRGRGSAAIATVYRNRGGHDTFRIPLDKSGDARRLVPFAAGKVRHVDLTMVNASARFLCWQGTSFSCQGLSADDGARARVRAVAVR